MTPTQRADERSRALHRAVVAAMDADPRVLVQARERVAHWLADVDGRVPLPYARAWAALLDGPAAELKAALDEDSNRMHDLRQVSPFAGALAAKERWAILKAVKSGFAARP